MKKFYHNGQNVIHHIFIFSGHKGEEANELVRMGFSEGSSRIHHGQGTANRIFHFRNFYMEILWVDQLSDIKKDKIRETGLWQRSKFRDNKMSPFGLCLRNSNSTDDLFQNCIVYQPDYLPEGKYIEVISNNDCPGLPWTFRLPKSMENYKTDEPEPHQNDIRNLTKVDFGVVHPNQSSVWSEYFQNHEMIQFKPASENSLTLTFDHNRQGISKKIQSLSLCIQY